MKQISEGDKSSKLQIRLGLMATALPLMLQNLASTFLTLIDTFLVSSIGLAAIAAIGIVNQVIFFLFTLLVFGINSGVSIFTAQFFGKKDPKNVSKSVSLSVLLSTGVAIIFVAICLLWGRQIIGIFSEDVYVIDQAVSFLNIIALSFVFMAISSSIMFGFRSIGKLKIPLLISVIAIAVNIVFNLILIPHYGVAGSGMGTLIARLFEFFLMMAYLLYDKSFTVNISTILSVDTDFIKLVTNTALPVLINEAVWALGIVVYTFAYSTHGTDSMAAVQITNVALNFLNVVFMGFGNATGILIGREIGAKNYKNAKLTASEITKISIFVSLMLMVIMIVFARPLVELFNFSGKLTGEAIESAVLMLIIAASFNIFRMFNINMIVGILRSGGDTKFSLFMEIGSIWCYGVPMAMLGVFVFKFSLPVLYFVITTEEFIKFFFGVYRYKTGKWLNNLVENVE